MDQRQRIAVWALVLILSLALPLRGQRARAATNDNNVEMARSGPQ